MNSPYRVPGQRADYSNPVPEDDWTDLIGVAFAVGSVIFTYVMMSWPWH